MSTAFFPTNMRAMPASGKGNRSTYQNIPYITWKGTGVFSNPVGTASSHIRPLTNNDSGNVFKSGSFPSRVYANVRVFNPRPIKQFRKGRVIPSAPITVNNPESEGPGETMEVALINYNMNRFVKSSKGQSLGGGHGGRGLIDEIQDGPGNYVVHKNPINEINESIQLNEDCKTCQGVGLVTDYYPNNTYLTNNPEPNTVNKIWCCNPEAKARKRVLPANTNLKPNYYTTLQQYRENRCKTFKQREFNFQTPNPFNIVELNNTDNPFVTPKAIALSKPGSPLALLNTYFANCQPNAEIYDATENAIIGKMVAIMVNQDILTSSQLQEFQSLKIETIQSFFNYLNTLPQPTQNLAITVFVDFINNPYWGMALSGPSHPVGCKLVVYKPNNYQFAKQGAVESSTRILKLNVDTITTNAASYNNYNANLNTAVPQLTNGIPPVNPFILKSKSAGCNTPPIYPFQNKKACYYQRYPSYQVPISQPSPYRYYRSTVFSSNHFSPSAITYLSKQ
jgi:hypothetical protein